MAKPEFPVTKIAFLQQLNGNPYNAVTNPYGLAKGGHRQLWPTSMNYMGDIAVYAGNLSDYLDALAEQVAVDAASAAAGSGTEADVANIRSGTSARYLSIRRVYDAAAPVLLAPVDGAVAVDMNAGINFQVAALTADLLVDNPTNVVSGKSGLIEIVQDATGGHQVTFAANWKFAGDGSAIGILPSERSIIAYYASSPGLILCTVAAGFQ